MFEQIWPLLAIIGAVLIVSALLSPKAKTADVFFSGQDGSTAQPRLLTLIFSQVTTWIFARSLMNAAILGYYYGVWGTLAYAAYYLSFVTGALIIDHIRFRHGHKNIQGLLKEWFGGFGTTAFNCVIGLRLVSEIFANLYVAELFLGGNDESMYFYVVSGIAVLTLLYAMIGGLRGSLRTDVLQFMLFAISLLVVTIAIFSNSAVGLGDLGQTDFDITNPGPILIVVALLQVWSYPAHDPVMMDRGFLADRRTTWLSFMHAFWISSLCIILFGFLGVIAGVHNIGEEKSTSNMVATIQHLIGQVPMLMFFACLVVSAMSTLDSALSSASKLIVKDMGLLKPTIMNGRLVMVGFMLAGLFMLFFGSKDLFSAVAVSGTASMFLAPVIFFNIWCGVKNIPLASYIIAFALSILGALLYFTETSGYSALLGDAHKYTKLLWICIVILLVSCVAFALGAALNQKLSRQPSDEG